MEAAVSIPIALGLGWLGDRAFGTEPILLVVGLVVGFAALVRRILRMRADVERAAAAAAGSRIPERREEQEEERFGIGDFGGEGRDDDD